MSWNLDVENHMKGFLEKIETQKEICYLSSQFYFFCDLTINIPIFFIMSIFVVENIILNIFENSFWIRVILTILGIFNLFLGLLQKALGFNSSKNNLSRSYKDLISLQFYIQSELCKDRQQRREPHTFNDGVLRRYESIISSYHKAPFFIKNFIQTIRNEESKKNKLYNFLLCCFCLRRQKQNDIMQIKI